MSIIPKAVLIYQVRQIVMVLPETYWLKLNKLSKSWVTADNTSENFKDDANSRNIYILGTRTKKAMKTIL